MTVIHEVEHDANTGTLKLKKKRKVRKRKDANMEQMEADETLPRSLTDRRKCKNGMVRPPEELWLV